MYSLFRNAIDSDEVMRIKNFIEKCEKRSKSIYTENLTSIQLNYHHNHHHRYYLSVKSNKFFVHKLKDGNVNKSILSYCSLKDHKDGDQLYYVYIPFFTLAIPGYCYKFPVASTDIFLLGNTVENRRVLLKNVYLMNAFRLDNHCSYDYTFKIY